jgi:hypothetical protein
MRDVNAGSRIAQRTVKAVVQGRTTRSMLFPIFDDARITRLPRAPRPYAIDLKGEYPPEDFKTGCSHGEGDMIDTIIRLSTHIRARHVYNLPPGCTHRV